MNDILLAMDDQQVSLLVLLDLSAAFDTVSCIEEDLGITNDAIKWFVSYLENRSQRVSVNGGVSRSFQIKQGVPQGSCLGPPLFTAYTSKLVEIVQHHLPQVHCYAHDMQLYFSFRQSESSDAVNITSNCIRDLTHWMISNNSDAHRF